METEKAPVFFYEKICKVTEPRGLYSWPCVSIVKEVADLFGVAGVGNIFIRRVDNEKIADPFSVMSVMMLAAPVGTELSVFTHEPGLVDKVDSLAQFIDTVNAGTTVDFDGFKEILKDYEVLKRAESDLFKVPSA